MMSRRFGFSRMNLYLEPHYFDTYYRLKPDLCESCRELIDLEIAVLNCFEDFGVKFSEETIHRSERVRFLLTRLTGGALSFQGGMEAINETFDESKRLMLHLKSLFEHKAILKN
jgi:hypothetical protein